MIQIGLNLSIMKSKKHQLNEKGEALQSQNQKVTRLKFPTQTAKVSPKNTGHLEWNALGDISESKTNGDSKEAL